MALPKLFQRIFWHNNTTPAINEDNLNAMSKAIDDIDDRVIALGTDVIEVVPQIQSYLDQAEDLYEAMELLSQNPPYIGSNGHWYVWDTNTSAFVDSGIDASITVDIADITMIAEGSQPYVTNTGTNTDPVFHLFIPRGATGEAGVSPIVTITTITGGHRVTISDEDHPTGQSFDVMDGTGSGDMRAAVYDPNGTVASAGGFEEYVGARHFATMPSATDLSALIAALFALPNNTVFETDGFWTQRDGNGGKYIISTSALRGGLEITDGTNTRYLCLLDDYGNPANEVNVCKYGIREYAGNLYTDAITKESTFATQNTYIITHIYLMKQLGTFKFPKGRFVFADPLDLRSRNITFEGACVPVISHGEEDRIANSSDSSPATILCFPFLQNGETAITTRYNISNLIVYGNFHTYDISFDRTKTLNDQELDPVVTETITNNIQCTGIISPSTAVIQNVLVAGFYKGIERSNAASGYFFNISFVRCHYGIIIHGDTKCIGVYGWDVHTLIRFAAAALQSVEQARVDNCVHMVELRDCRGVTLHDFDGDYCTDSMVLVEGGAEAVIATAFHARCCTLKSYDGSGGADPIDVRDLADTNGYGIIRLANSRYLKNCHFSFNRIGGQNPFDNSSNYKTPETVLTMDNWAKFEDCTFELPIAADDSDYILSLFQTNANCKGRVDTSSGTYYIEGTSANNGTKYMEQTQTVSTSTDTTYTFTNAAITADSVIDVYASEFGINPSNVAVSSGSCVVTIPKQSSAISLGIRIYIK